MMEARLTELIQLQAERLALLQKRLAGVDEMLAQGQRERFNLEADIIEASGKLEGLKAAAHAVAVVPQPQDKET